MVCGEVFWAFIESEEKEYLQTEFSSRFETEHPKFKRLTKVKHSFSHFKFRGHSLSSGTKKRARSIKILCGLTLKM